MTPRGRRHLVVALAGIVTAGLLSMHGLAPSGHPIGTASAAAPAVHTAAHASYGAPAAPATPEHAPLVAGHDSCVATPGPDQVDLAPPAQDGPRAADPPARLLAGIRPASSQGRAPPGLTLLCISRT